MSPFTRCFGGGKSCKPAATRQKKVADSLRHLPPYRPLQWSDALNGLERDYRDYRDHGDEWREVVTVR